MSESHVEKDGLVKQNSDGCSNNLSPSVQGYDVPGNITFCSNKSFLFMLFAERIS